MEADFSGILEGLEDKAAEDENIRERKVRGRKLQKKNRMNLKKRQKMQRKSGS